MTQTTSRRSALAMIIGVSALTACTSLLGGGEPPRMFRLTPKTTFPKDLSTVDWSLAVAEPVADRALDTNRVAVVSQATDIDYVANAIWVDRAPVMIQGLIVQSFRASGAIVTVGTSREQQQPDFALRSKLRLFQIKQGGETSTARVGLDTSLLTTPDRATVDQATFTHETIAMTNTMDDIVIAFDEALGKVLKATVLWTLTAGKQIAAS